MKESMKSGCCGCCKNRPAGENSTCGTKFILDTLTNEKIENNSTIKTK